MFASRLFILTTLVACSAVTSHKCYAQPNGHAYGLENIVSENDLRWFEPADLDLDGRLEKEAGYFFRWDKLGYYATGERITVGQEGLEVQSEIIYPDGASNAALQVRIDQLARVGIAPTVIEAILGIELERDGMGDIVTRPVLDPGDVSDPTDNFTFDSPIIEPTSVTGATSGYSVKNGIQDATPDAELGWGERYEFGYSDGDRGWSFGILNGPDVVSQRTYGFGPGGPNRTDGDVDNNGADDSDPNVPTVGDVRAFGFGSVPVNFNLPSPTFLNGFRNYINNALGAESGVQYGPLYYVGNYQADEESQDGDGDNAPTADDLDGDGVSGVITVLADLDGDGTLDDDEILATIIDFDDIYTFNVFFDDVTTRSTLEMDGVEWMFTHNLDKSHELDRGRRDELQLSYGIRFDRLRSEFDLTANGSIFGRTTSENDVDNQIVGPQVGLRWRRDHGKWDFSADGRFMFGYNIVDIGQENIFGQDAIPGALNRSNEARTTASAYGRSENEFSPIGELRLEARYKFTRALALKMGYNVKFIENIHRASRVIEYNAPDFGIGDGRSDILINGLTMGVEFRH